MWNIIKIGRHEVKWIEDFNSKAVTMCLTGEGGPIMSGKDYYEAYGKIKEALLLFDAIVAFEKITKWNKTPKLN